MLDKKILIAVAAIIVIGMGIIAALNFFGKDKSEFKIYIVENIELNSIGGNYETPLRFGMYTWSDFLEAAKLEKVLIEEKDIEEYDWTNQEIVLTKQAADRIKGMYDKNSLNLIEKPFVVVLNKKRIYGGAILRIPSARVADYPVIYVENLFNQEKPSITIRPYHSIYPDIQNEKKPRIEKPEIKEFFSKKGKLKE